MRKLIILTLMAATVLPTTAMAQSNREVRQDRRDLREEQRELDQARRHGDRRDIRDERRDVRDARQELREDIRDRDRRWGRNDWSGWRDRNRALYARGNWNAPFRYYAFRPGVRIAPSYYGPRYFIADPWRYRLPQVGYNQRWVRHYNDVLLIDTRRGVVVDVIRNFYW
ncbi:MAG: RcnB family protein [Pseudomonadota bacterium]|jgi:Ni/Co efflux regulator RcnB|uniref:Go_function: nucleotide binding [goid 0000166] / KOW domain-containing transcription factor family protein n=1 Tax=hydrothermal vent metagenome TaxID=652676 RepID=A0A160THX3_9ZZZZ